MPTAEAKSPPAKSAATDIKPVERAREPLWSKTGLFIMVAIWLITLAAGVAGVALFAGAPSATGTRDTNNTSAPKSFGLVDGVRVNLVDEDGSLRNVSFNLLLDFGADADKSRADLEQGNFKHAISYQAEELLRGYSARQASERTFAKDFGVALKRQLNELYGSNGKEYVRAVLVQKLSIGG